MRYVVVTYAYALLDETGRGQSMKGEGRGGRLEDVVGGRRREEKLP